MADPTLENLSGIEFPISVPPSVQTRIRQKASALQRGLGNPKLAREVREAYKLAFDEIRKQAEAMGARFVVPEVTEPPPGVPPPVPPPEPRGGTLGALDALTAGIGARQRRERAERMAAAGLEPSPHPSVTREIAPPAAPPAAVAPAPVTPPAGRPEALSISGEPGTFTPATGGEPAPVVPELLPPEPEEPESADIAALRAALATPVPSRRKPRFDRVEGIVLSFLAGLRGVEAALPFIQMRERQADVEFESALTERRERISGLAGLAQITEQSRARREMMAMRRATQEWTRRLQMHRIENDLWNRQIRVAHLDLARAADARAEARFVRLPVSVADGIGDMGQLLRNLDRLIPLVESGAGGPIAAGVFQSHRGWLPNSQDTIDAATLWADSRLLISPDRIGRAGTGIEVSGLGGNFFDVGIANNRGRQLSVLRQFRDLARQQVERLATNYNPESVYKAAGLWPQAAQAGLSAGTAAIPPLPPGVVPVVESDIMLYDSAEAP